MSYVMEQVADPADLSETEGGFEPVEAPQGRQTRGIGLEAGQRLASLVRAIEDEIVPRLLLSGREVPIPRTSVPEGSARPTEADVQRLCELALGQDQLALDAFVERQRGRGTALETLFLHLLAPAARRLGRLWEADLCDFTQVTLGLWRLQKLLRALSPQFVDGKAITQDKRRALLVPTPGEQHTFGVSLVAEFFRRDGWDVWCAPVRSHDELAGLVANQWFAVVGFSASSERRLDDLRSGIRTVRRASCNNEAGVMVGGPLFNYNPGLVARVGADATGPDGRQAADLAGDLCSFLKRRS